MNTVRKILIIVGDLTYGGIQTCILNYLKNIDNEKFSFDIVVHNKGDNSVESEYLRYCNKILQVPKLSEVGLIKYISILRGVIIANGPYDVVHAHTHYKSGIELMAAKQAGVNVRISHSHNTVGKPNFQMLFYRWFINRTATLKLACSELAGNYLYKNKDFSVLNNAIELDKFNKCSDEKNISIRNSLNIDVNTLVVLHVGRFTTAKNHNYILDIIKSMPKDTDICFAFAGEGPLKAEIEKRANDYNISDKIRFLGNRNDIQDLLNCFNVFILPSFNEGLPLVLIEAQAVGVPCLVSDKVTSEVDMELGNMRFISIEEDPKVWAKYILQTMDKEKAKKDKIYLQFEKHGYNIKSAAKTLEKFYIAN